MRRAQGQNTVPHEGFEPRTARYGAPFYCILITKKAPIPTAKSAPAILRSMHMRGKFYEKIIVIFSNFKNSNIVYPLRKLPRAIYRDFFSGNDRNISMEIFDIFFIFLLDME